jgi:hypothetical protein
MRTARLLVAALGLALLLAVPAYPSGGNATGVGSHSAGVESEVRPLVAPSYTCGGWDGNPPNGTAPCNVTIAVTAGDTFVGVAAMNSAQSGCTGFPSFSGSWWTSSVVWFKNVTAAGGPEIFAMKATVTTTGSFIPVWTAPSSCDLWGLGWDFTGSVTVPSLVGSGSTGSGTTLSDPLSGTATSATLIGAWATTRPVGTTSVSGTWNSSVNCPNYPNTLSCEAEWAWENGAFSVPNPTFTTGSSVTWAALSFVVGPATPPPTYGYLEKTYPLPGFNPLTGYLENWGGGNTQVPTLSSSAGQPAGIYYVDNSSDLDLLYLSNGTSHSVAHVVLLYQTYASYNEMLDNEFFIEYGYDQALLFGTSTSGGSTYSIELVNLTSGTVRIWNTTAAVDSTNQQPDYVGNNTVIVMSSNGTILAWNLASHKEWSAGTLAFFEANNAYWFPQRHQIVNVEAGGSSSDQVQQLNATYNAQGEIQFSSVATIAVDSGVTFNWVNGLVYNATVGEIAFTAGYWAGNTVYTFLVPYAASGLLTTTGLVRVPVDTGGSDSGKLVDVQRYVYTSDYVLGESSGTGWTNTTQPLYDPWNGSLLPTNRSLDTGVNGCANNCFEGQYALSPAYQIDYNATMKLNDPMYRVVYAYHNASSVSPSGPASLNVSPTSGPAGTVVTLSGSGYAASTVFDYCFQQYVQACASGATFTSTSGGDIPSGTTIDAPATNGNFVDVSQTGTLVADAPFTVTESGGSGGGTTFGAPGNVTAAAGLTCTEVVVSWTNPHPPSGDIVNDTVYAFETTGSLFQVVDSGKLATSLGVSFLACGQTYVFKVRAWDTAGNASPLSDGVTFTTASLPATIANPTGGSAGGGLSPVAIALIAAAAGLFLVVLLVFALASRHGRSRGGRHRG